MSNEAPYVVLERLHSESRIEAERGCEDNHPTIATQCTHEHKTRQARDHTAEDTNVSHMSLDHARLLITSSSFIQQSIESEVTL